MKTGPLCKYAQGMRWQEVKPPVVDSTFMENGGACLVVNNVRDRRQRVYRELAWCSVEGYAPYCWDANDPETFRAAFVSRLFVDMPHYDDSLIKEFRRFCVEHFPKMFHKVFVMSFEEWLETTSYNEARKQQLRDAYAKLRGGVPTKKHMKVKIHVKKESYPAEMTDEEFKPPRGISSRSDVFKAWAGPFIKSVEREVFQSRWFIKHIPIPDRPKFLWRLNKKGAYKYESDYSKFEASFSRSILSACEMELYAYVLSEYPEFLRIYKKALCSENGMYTDKGHKGTCSARRQSGEMSTSLGNGITNLMLFLFICHKHDIEGDCAVEGDDGLYSVSAPLKSEWFEQLGFKIKLVQVQDIFHANFCGMTFSEAGELIRNPRYVLQTFGWIEGYLQASDKVLKELLRAKALSLCYETPQCPIIGALGRYALEVTKGSAVRWVNDGYHKVPKDSFPIKSFNPDPSTRVLVQEFFDISVETQLKVEELIMSGRLCEIQSLLTPPNLIRKYYDNYVVRERWSTAL